MNAKQWATQEWDHHTNTENSEIDLQALKSSLELLACNDQAHPARHLCSLLSKSLNGLKIYEYVKKD